jgi:cytidylate kinase
MRTWALKLQSQQRLAEQQAAAPVPKLIQPYLAISRETGADGGELARRVAHRIGWKVFDRELLDYMAEHYHMSRLSLEFVDETAASWFHEMFGKWLETHLVSQAEYVSRLGRIVLLAAQHERTIFVGRGVQFILPRDAGLMVRIVAPLKQRVACIVERRQCTQREAEKFVEESDRGRAQFVERYFHRDLADPHLYGLVINLAQVPMDDAVELIADQCQRRFP